MSSSPAPALFAQSWLAAISHSQTKSKQKLPKMQGIHMQPSLNDTRGMKGRRMDEYLASIDRSLGGDDSPADKVDLSLVGLLGQAPGKALDKHSVPITPEVSTTLGFPSVTFGSLGDVFGRGTASQTAADGKPAVATAIGEAIRFSKEPTGRGSFGRLVEALQAEEVPAFSGADRAAGRTKDYSVPPEMKYGAAADAWDRVSPAQQKELVQKISDLKTELLDRSAAISKTEKTSSGAIVKRDSEGRVVCLEKPDKNIRMHFKYDGKSDTAIAMVLEDTKTRSAKTFLAVQSSKDEAIGGKRDWIAVDSKGKREHFAGEITVGKSGGHSIRLDSVTKQLEKLEKLVKPGTVNDEVSKAREGLERAAEKRFTDPKELAQYKEGLEKFQREAKEKGLPDKEIAEFFKESTRLLEPEAAKLGVKERCRVAREALAQASDPTGIDQGRYKTCNVTAVEVCMYSKNPSKVMKAITDVSLTGKFKTADGDVIIPPASILNPDTQRRTLASQIFQTLAVNTHWQGKTEGPDRKKHDRGDVIYDHAGAKRANGDTGQRVTVTDEKGDRVVAGDHSPNLNTDNYPEIYRRIAGENPDTLAIRFGKTKGPEGVDTVASKDALHAKLAELSKKPGGFPIILKIHTSNKPFWEDSGAGVEPGAGSTVEEAKKTNKIPGGWHVVTIHGYDPVTGEVKVDNQWGRAVDHLGKSTGKEPIGIADLFEAMQTHDERLEKLGYDPKAKPKTQSEK